MLELFRCYPMDMENIRVITGHAEGEITEKRSRFIANVYEIHSESEALKLLEGIRKKYYDARHSCYAYVIGERNDVQRFSDDKEPQGTAGKPILDVILNNCLHNTLIIVTRYFGGILLGTGGLTRAYSSAASEGIRNAEESGLISPLYTGVRASLSCSYNLTGKLQYLIGNMDIPVENTTYGTDVSFDLLIPDEKYEAFTKKITEATNAASACVSLGPCSYIISNGKPVIYSL